MTDRGRMVLDIARGAIEQALGVGPTHTHHDAPWLQAHGSCFVTLHRDGDLRGCIGSLEPYRSLAEDIAGNAIAAALHDRRFPPVGTAELDKLKVEVSLLTPAEPLACADEGEALRMLRPGIDGVVIEFAGHRATFLPQVWESLPDASDFLRELKRKAGLPTDFWHPALRLKRYRVEKYAERSLIRE